MARRPQNSRRREPAPGWVWMLFGLGLGLLVAIGVYLRTPRTPAAPAATATAAATPPAEKKPEPRERTERQTAKTTTPSPPPVTDDKRFQFYDILPQFEVVVPRGDPRGGAAPPSPHSAPVQQPGRYLLQAGSFSTTAEADRMQATLALRGIESRVQQAMVDGNAFYRVQIGPIEDLDTLNRTRRQLLDAGIEALPLKLRE
ncbi:MAG TPA: SPOR domain-containing protein [Gammaproteobacteria bacterium]|jgi:cell division protein FtsN|nr:SPOR domain-containing protein [Gammaproteobacteria bacterium]